MTVFFEIAKSSKRQGRKEIASVCACRTDRENQRKNLDSQRKQRVQYIMCFHAGCAFMHVCRFTLCVCLGMQV